VTLRFVHVCTVDSVSLDLNVTLLSGYLPQTVKNSVVGTLYKLTMREATQTYVRFTFVKSSTLTQHVVGKVTLTVSGWDNGLDGSLEFVGTSDWPAHFWRSDCEV